METARPLSGPTCDSGNWKLHPVAEASRTYVLDHLHHSQASGAATSHHPAILETGNCVPDVPTGSLDGVPSPIMALSSWNTSFQFPVSSFQKSPAQAMVTFSQFPSFQTPFPCNNPCMSLEFTGNWKLETGNWMALGDMIQYIWGIHSGVCSLSFHGVCSCLVESNLQSDLEGSPVSSIAAWLTQRSHRASEF